MFEYKVKFWDEDNGKNVIDSGIVAGESYGKAIERVIDYYGRDYVIYVKMLELDSIIPKDEFEDYFNDEDTEDE